MAGPKRKEKTLVEKTFSQYPRKKRKARVLGVKAPGPFQARARLNGDLSGANYFLLRFFLPQRGEKGPPRETELCSFICQLYL